MLPTLALVAMIAGFSAWHYARQRYVLTLSVYFNVCALAYMVFGMAIARANMGAQYEAELELIGWMCVAAVAGFNVAYLVAGLGAAPPGAAGPRSGYLPSHSSMLVVASIGFAFAASIVLLIGPLEFLFSDRVVHFAVRRNITELLYVANLTNVCLPIVLARYLHYRQRRDYTLLIVLLAHGIALGLMTISRYDLMIVLLAVGFFLERYYRFRPIPLLCVLAVALASTLVYKPLLYNILLGREYATNVDLGEYVNWIRHTLLMLGRPEVEMPHGGYALALRSLFVIRPQEDSLSEWFFQEFFADRLILFPGTGYGFTGVWEGYSANGLFGVAMHFAFFGAVFGWLERSQTPMRHIFVVFAMVLTYRLFRSEAYNFVKTYSWYFAYPTIGIVLADRFLVWASGARSGEAAAFHGRPPRAGARRDAVSMRPGREDAVSG